MSATRPPMRRLKQPPLLAHFIQQSIREYIRDHRLKPGDPLPPESELACQLGIGRNSVREAVKGLESTGVIEARRGAGLFVGSFSFIALLENLPYGLMDDLRQLRELIEIRLILEAGLIERAIESVTPERLAELEDVLTRMKNQAERGGPLSEEDREFHRVLFEAADNKMLLKLLDVFWLAYRKAAESIDLRNNELMQTYEDHRRIVEAVKSRNAKAAREALVDQHYAGLLRRLEVAERRLLDSVPRASPTEAGEVTGET